MDESACRAGKERLAMRIGLDIGSTTIKCVVYDDSDNLIFKTYKRHYSHIVEKAR